MFHVWVKVQLVESLAEERGSKELMRVLLWTKVIKCDNQRASASENVNRGDNQFTKSNWL